MVQNYLKVISFVPTELILDYKVRAIVQFVIHTHVRFTSELNFFSTVV